jgi:transposase-like protein
MATKRHPAFWSYLKGMSKEISDFENMVSQGGIPECKYCGSNSVIKYGYYSGIQRWWCKECKRKFADNKAPPGMKTSTNQIAFTLTMYLEGRTINYIRRKLQEIYNSYPSDSTLYNWIEQFTKRAILAEKKLKPKVGETWIAHETPIVIGEREAWFWDIIDIDTGYILASKLCMKRTASAARVLMTKAINKAAKLPRVVISDRLNSYISDIEFSFGIETRHIKTRRINIDSNTQLLEKLHSALKARTVIVERFKNINSARTLIRGWPVHYNFLRPQEIAQNNTPAHRAGISHQLKIRIR